LKDRIFNETDPETRGWASTALMQLFHNNKEIVNRKTKLLNTLKVALHSEQNDYALNCILVSIQEISGKKLGLSPRDHEIVSKEILEKVKKKATKLLQEI
jgi:hypothetical protein